MGKSLVIVGAGRVGRGLGKRLRELGWNIRSVAARSEASAQKAVRFIGGGRAQAGVSRLALSANVILLTVPDDAIAGVAQELARMGGEELRRRVVLHTSGALAANVLEPLRDCGASVASMHPLQTFSGVGVPPLEGKVFAIEGDPAAVRVARRMARALGGIPVSITSEKKPLYHAAGAFAAGLVLALEETAVQMLMASGMKRREAVRSLLSLSRQVLEHYDKLGPNMAWTGPLSREDYRVVACHEAALRKFRPEYLEAYQAVSRLAARVLSRDPVSMLKALENISTEARPLMAAKTKGGTA
jgi:predicted short-subunit dehydrogenase-like oxidoreductase (DUF2520 family)